MNWETQQVEHLVSGNFGYAHYEYWNVAAMDALEETLNRDSAINLLVQRMEAELSDPLGGGGRTGGSEEMDKCFGEMVGDLYHAFVQGGLGEVDWRDVAETAIEGAE